MWTLQHFGSAAEDRRCAFFYQVTRPDEQAFLDEIGIAPATSRASGILQGEALDKVKAWLHRDMGGGRHYHRACHQVVDGLSRATVRGVHTHGDDTRLRAEPRLPMICIGDALRNIGLGGGGQLAMQDVLELVDFLCSDGCFDPDSGRLCDVGALRGLEASMLGRRQEFYVEQQARLRRLLWRHPGDVDPNFANTRAVVRALDASSEFVATVVSLLAPLSVRWWEHDEKRGGAGSLPDA